MTYLQQVVETLMREGHSPDEIIRAAERSKTGERVMDRVNMVQFASKLCRMDEVDNELR